MMRPVMTAVQVTQQVSGLLVSSSMSLWQQHRQTRYTARTSRLRPRPTAPTHARNIRDWGMIVEREKKAKEKKCHQLKLRVRSYFISKNKSTKKNFSRLYPQMCLKRQLLCVVLRCQARWPHHSKGWQPEGKQPTSIKQHSCVKICCLLHWHYHCWLQPTPKGGKMLVVLGRREPTEIFLPSATAELGPWLTGKQKWPMLWEGSIMWHDGFHSVLWFVYKIVKAWGLERNTDVK